MYHAPNPWEASMPFFQNSRGDKVQHLKSPRLGDTISVALPATKLERELRLAGNIGAMSFNIDLVILCDVRMEDSSAHAGSLKRVMLSYLYLYISVSAQRR